MLKHIHPSLQNNIILFYNKIFLTANFPTAWKSAIVIPIPKPNKDHKHAINYRPISLTRTLCKLLEKIINARLMWILEKNSHICQPQSGFRRNRSTIDNLASFDTYIKNSRDLKLHTIAIFFDIQKAYDTAWRYGVLKSLHSYGLRGPLPLFISNFLSNRSIKVRIGRTLSPPAALEEGIPQGCVLSCTLFLIAINTISLSLPNSVSSMIYVDDFTIYASGATTRSIERQLQLALRSLEKWSLRTGFSFSPAKTTSIHICRKHHCPKLAPSLTLHGTPISCTPTVKYLGVTIDNSYTWKPHLRTLKIKCHKTLNLFKKLSHSSWGSDSPTLVRLYIMLLKPAVEYGLEAYSSAAHSYIDSICTIQNAALRIATGAFRTSPITSLHALTSLLPQSYTSHLKQLNFYLRLVVNTTHPLHDKLIEQDDISAETIIERTPSNSFLSRAHSLHLLYNLDSSIILSESTSAFPPWRIHKLSVCTELFSLSKRDTPGNTLRDAFHDHITAHTNSFCIFTDGSKTADGVGYALFSSRGSSQCRLTNAASIYTAELYAIQ